MVLLNASAEQGDQPRPELRYIMGKVESIEQAVQALTPEEVADFRAWFAEFDWAAWDRQIERDIRADQAWFRMATASGGDRWTACTIWVECTALGRWCRSRRAFMSRGRAASTA
jgi:hypothetical protein